MQTALYYIMHKAAEKAGRSLMRDFTEVENLQVSIKGPGDFVSRADKNAENIIIDSLQRDRPEIGILSEEVGKIDFNPHQACWIIDPLDGTTNFLHGLGHFAISIALSEGKKLIAAMVYDPIRGECFFAEHRKGAFLNGNRLKVAKRNRPPEALFATGIPFINSDTQWRERFCCQLNNFMKKTSGVRRYGAASLDLAYVAAGRYDGFWEENLKIWDVAAGFLIVREAGGVISDFQGKAINQWQPEEIIACNFDLHNFMQEQMQ